MSFDLQSTGLDRGLSVRRARRALVNPVVPAVVPTTICVLPTATRRITTVIAAIAGSSPATVISILATRRRAPAIVVARGARARPPSTTVVAAFGRRIIPPGVAPVVAKSVAVVTRRTIVTRRTVVTSVIPAVVVGATTLDANQCEQRRWGDRCIPFRQCGRARCCRGVPCRLGP
jgi:hypothetical protein